MDSLYQHPLGIVNEEKLNEGDILRFGHEISEFFDRTKLEQYDRFRNGNCLIIQVKDENALIHFYYEGSLFRYDTLSDEINVIFEQPIHIFVNGYVSEFDITNFLRQERKFMVNGVIFYYIQHDIIFYRVLDSDELIDMKREKFISFLKEIICNHFNKNKVYFFIFDHDDRRVITSKLVEERDNEFWSQMPTPMIEELPEERHEIIENPLSILDL